MPSSCGWAFGRTSESRGHALLRVTSGTQRSNLGKKLDSSYIRHALKRITGKAGIDKRVHAHGFRHSGAVRLLKAGANVGVISGGLGHSSIATTSRYLAHLHPEEGVLRGRWGDRERRRNGTKILRGSAD